MRIVPSGKILGATIEDIDLAKPVTSRMSGQILKALGEHGVLRFPISASRRRPSPASGPVR